MENRNYGYARVSTSGQNEQRQVQALLEQGVDERFIFIDKISGRSITDRPQLEILKNALRKGDTLFIKSLDRLSRKYSDTKNFLLYLQEAGVDIVVIDMLPLLDTRQYKDLLGTFIFDLIVNILSYVSEQERTYIKQRQREGIDLYLKTGKTKTGRPYGRPRIAKPDNWEEVITKWKNGNITARESMRLLDLKPNKFYRLVKEEKVERS